MLKGMRCYLAGPIDHCANFGKEWRDAIKPELWKLGVEVFDPCDKPIDIGIEDAEGLKRRQKLLAQGDFATVAREYKIIRHTDLRMVDASDFIIVHIDKNVYSCGTWEELFTANRQKKPVLIHVQQGKENVPMWLLGTVPHDMIFSTWTALLEYLTMIDEGYPFHRERWVMFDYQKLIGMSRNDSDTTRGVLRRRSTHLQTLRERGVGENTEED